MARRTRHMHARWQETRHSHYSQQTVDWPYAWPQLAQLAAASGWRQRRRATRSSRWEDHWNSKDPRWTRQLQLQSGQPCRTCDTPRRSTTSSNRCPPLLSPSPGVGTSASAPAAGVGIPAIGTCGAEACSGAGPPAPRADAGGSGGKPGVQAGQRAARRRHCEGGTMQCCVETVRAASGQRHHAGRRNARAQCFVPRRQTAARRAWRGLQQSSPKLTFHPDHTLLRVADTRRIPLTTNHA